MGRALPISDAKIQIRLPRDLRERAEQVAAANSRTLAGQIRWLLMQNVAEHEDGNGPGANGAAAKTTTVPGGRRARE